MKLKNTLVYTFAVLTLPLTATIAPAASIQVLQTFDYPGIGNSTLPQKISDQGVIVGTVIEGSGAVGGFFYKPRIERFSDRPFTAPNDTGNPTLGRGVNNNRYACGEYLNPSDGAYHGYLLEHPLYITFDVSGSQETIPLGINNAGNFVGAATLGDGAQAAFLNLGGVVTTFQVPGATATYAYQLNKGNQIIGYYNDLNAAAHGFTRDHRGSMVFPIDKPGAIETLLLGNNDSNWGVGRYTDAAGATHGLFYITSDTILTYDYPGAVFTSLNGINKGGYVCGYYVDTAGIAHGIWAKLNLNGVSAPDTSKPVVSVNLAFPLLEMLRNGAPAL